MERASLQIVERTSLQIAEHALAEGALAEGEVSRVCAKPRQHPHLENTPHSVLLIILRRYTDSTGWGLN